MTVWLVEMSETPQMPVRWWNPAPNMGWMRDANEALWFVRQSDAEAYRASMRFGHNCCVTEHKFIGTPPAAPVAGMDREAVLALILAATWSPASGPVTWTPGKTAAAKAQAEATADAIVALSLAPAGGWEDIETAPRVSRQEFLAWDGESQFVVYWNSGAWWRAGLKGTASFTHWCPLPPPPSDTGSMK